MLLPGNEDCALQHSAVEGARFLIDLIRGSPLKIVPFCCLPHLHLPLTVALSVLGPESGYNIVFVVVEACILSIAPEKKKKKKKGEF